MWPGGAPPAAVFANVAAPMQAEEEMSRSESFVRSTLDSLDSHIAVVGETGEILSVNEAWRRFCAANGGDAGNACGVGVNYLRVCEVAAAGGCAAAGELAEGLRAVLSQQVEGFELEYDCHSPEVRRWFVARVTPGGDGPHRAVIAHENITHRVLAEEALVAERSRLRTVLDTIPDLVWVKDPEGVFLACNAAFARSMGRDEREIVGGRDADFCPPEVARTYRLHDLEAITLGGPSVDEEWLVSRDAQTPVCFETIKTPVLDPEGRLLGVLGIARDVTQARVVAESLRQSEEHYRALAETTFDWIWEVDAEVRYTFVSPRVVQLLGYEPEEVLGRTPFELMPEEEARTGRRALQELRPRSAPFANLENVNRHKDGRLVVLESSGVPFFGADGDLRGYRGMDRDITARKQAERRSAMQAEVSRVLAASSSLAEAAQGLLRAIGEPEEWSFGALWECGQGDSTLTCVDWWAAPGVDAAALGATTRHLRLRRGEGFPGEIWAEARPRWIADLPADKDCRRQAEAAALHLRGAVGFPIRLGEELLGVIDFLGMSMSEPDLALQEAFESVGRQIGLFVDRRRGETALRRFVSGSPAVIYALRIEAEGQRLVWYSDNIEAMTGWESIPGDGARWWAENVHPEDQSAIQASFALPYEHDHLVLEFRFRRRDGRFLWVRDERRLLRDADGRPTEIVGSWTDVTERVELEEKLRVAQKLEAIGRLAGGVAHDFNNMLTVIGGNGEMLDRALAPEATERLLLGEIREAAARAATLTRQLLAFSRTQVLAPQVVGLDAVVGRVESMLRRLIGEDIALTCELGPETGHVLVDPGQLEQVIVNLVVNARDAMPQGGTLTLRDRRRRARCGRLPQSTRARARALRPPDGPRLGHRHERRNPRANLRTVLHHQAGRHGHRTRSVDRLRHRQAERWPHRGGERRGAGDVVRDLPAAAAGASGGRSPCAGRGRGAGPGRDRPVGRGRSGCAPGGPARPRETGLHRARRRERTGGAGDRRAAGRRDRPSPDRPGDAGDERAGARRHPARPPSRTRSAADERLRRGRFRPPWRGDRRGGFPAQAVLPGRARPGGSQGARRSASSWRARSELTVRHPGSQDDAP